MSNKDHIEYIIFVKLFVYRPIEIQEEFFLNINGAIADNNNNNQDFDKTISNIVNVIVSYDMGWSKRGNGRSYDSLNGYGAIIGFL